MRTKLNKLINSIHETSIYLLGLKMKKKYFMNE